MDPALIGSLITYTTSLIDIVKQVRSAFSHSSRDSVATSLRQMYERVNVLSEQLAQSERLTRMVPAWLELANRMPVWQQASDLDPRDARALDADLRSLVNDSIRDHFSATFFRSSFDRLPDVPLRVQIFRDRITTLDRTVSTVQPGNFASLQALWPQITTQFNDTRNAAYEIQRLADDLHGQLIDELREASAQGLQQLPA
jgi:hypothetical protein